MSDTDASLLLNALDKRWNEYYAELKLCRREASREAIHDLRVAARRLLAVIELLRTIMPHPRLQRMRTSFNNQLDNLEELRDIQVVQAEISEVIRELPESKPFLVHLEKREKNLLYTTEKQVHLLKPGNLIKRISTVRRSVVKLYEDGKDINNQLFETVDDAFGLVLHRTEMLDQTRPATIHRLRIAFRKFRYMVEIVHPALAGYSPDNLSQLHDFQDSMGYIQDIEILLDHLNEFTEKETKFDPEPVRNYFQLRHDDAVQAFFQDMPKVKSFWRTSMKAAFPWRRTPRKAGPKPPVPAGSGEKAENESGTASSNPESIP
jgi:CHAD domain-containing protein